MLRNINYCIYQSGNLVRRIMMVLVPQNRSMAMLFIRRRYGIASLAALVGGLVIYFFFRNRNVVLFTWLLKPAFLNSFFIPIKPSAFASFLRYNLPDMLWFLSGVLLLRCLWTGQRKWQFLYIAVFYIIAMTIEISQLGENVPGTFDPLDLLFMGITAIFEGVIYNFFIKRRIVL